MLYVYNVFFRNSSRFYSSGVSKHYDVVISGGGMIGSTLACALAQNPILKELSILMIETAPKKETHFSKTSNYSNRVSSINLSSKNLLESLGVWDHIQSTRLQTVDKMKIWGHCSDEFLEFDKDHNYQDNISFIVENDLIIDSVNKQLLKNNNIDVIYEKTIKQYELPKDDTSTDTLKIKMESGETYETNLLLGTDGPNSQVRKSMNIQYTNWNYDQRGIVGTLKINTTLPNKTAWQRFIPTGTIALLPLTDNLSSLVWSTTKDNAKVLLQMSPESFVDALNTELNKPADLTKPIELTKNLTDEVLNFFNLSIDKEVIVPPRVISLEEKSRAAFPLSFGHAVRYIGPRTALLGDSAHKIHPLAGQGVNLGFGDIKDFINIFAESISNGYQVGETTYLKKYESIRQRENIPTMISVDLMHRIYTCPLTPVKVVGSLGFQVINALRPVKRLMMNRVS